MSADGFSEGDVKEAAQRVSDQAVQATVPRAKIVNEVKSVLTDEQKDQLKMLANRRSGRLAGFVDARLADLDGWIAAHAQ